MRIHFISMGGSIMHNLALELNHQGHQVTGSDDEIYNPAKDRLAEAGILPKEMGWFESNITEDIDIIIIGMHARIDNPELIKAQSMGLKIYSFPEYIYNASIDKKRIAICGSHGKTTTTSMILHVFKELDINSDYLVGAQLEGFERMVKLTDAPIITVEGDEYLSSAIDRRPKMLHYHPEVAVITGIAWDHINVFKTFEDYLVQFKRLIENLSHDSTLIYYENDLHLEAIIKELKPSCKLISYTGFKANKNVIEHNNEFITTHMFGAHNFQNMEAAMIVCKSMGVSEKDFFEAISNFKGAAKRLQPIEIDNDVIAYLDFAHAPSKLEATIKAVKSMYPDKELYAFYELHTYSSFDPAFMSHYKDKMNDAEHSYLFIHQHSLDIKKKAMPDHSFVMEAFNNPKMKILTEVSELTNLISGIDKKDQVFLFMSSGNFGGLNIQEELNKN